MLAISNLEPRAPYDFPPCGFQLVLIDSPGYEVGQSDYAAQHARWFRNNCNGNIHCSQRRQPSYAAAEGEGRI